MDVVSGRSSSSLNPNAPLFVPWAYRTVEDFSEEWWELVKSTAWFRDYWLRECFREEPQNDLDFVDNYEPVLPDVEDLFDGYQQQEIGKEEKGYSDLIPWGAQKWRGTRGPSEGSKYTEKAPKIVNVKVSPRTIQQPR